MDIRAAFPPNAPENRRWLRRFVVAVSFIVISVSVLEAESLTIVNRTGQTLELIQAAPAGQDHWGNDLVPDRVLGDGDSILIELIGSAPWSFRFLDSKGEVYVFYDVEPSLTGKLTVGPEHLARLSVVAGPEREILVTNRTGGDIISLRVSSVADDDWGDDVLRGRTIRNGETAPIGILVPAGALSFDLRFTLLSSGRELSYEKASIILTDGASIVLSVR